MNKKVMPDDHSEVVPLLPIPNRTVKRLRANDSADSRVKVGHRQASIPNAPSLFRWGVFICAQQFHWLRVLMAHEVPLIQCDLFGRQRKSLVQTLARIPLYPIPQGT